MDPPKSNRTLSQTEPPLTVSSVTAGITLGVGGGVTTPATEVVDNREEVIEGLFATGNCTGGLFYRDYPGGTGLTNTAVFGKLAAERGAERAPG